ncbi:MAG: hypothetical protein Q7K45_01350 [Nanoarchaeota archaeon]|nr:hypothetical protein [Nanoarchaeota archaeon]
MTTDNIEQIMIAILGIPATIGVIAGADLYYEKIVPTFCPKDSSLLPEYICQSANATYAALVGATVGAGFAASGLTVVLGIAYTLSPWKSENYIPKPWSL